MFNLPILTLCICLPSSEEPNLGSYFGFNDLEVIKLGDNPGPAYSADINGDGLEDILVVNNHKSRIDLLLQKEDPSPNTVVEVTRPNEIPEHWRFEKQRIMVSHKVSSLAIHDFNNDGKLDIIYVANPTHIVFLAQQFDGQFTKTRTHRLRKITASVLKFQ